MDSTFENLSASPIACATSEVRWDWMPLPPFASPFAPPPAPRAASNACISLLSLAISASCRPSFDAASATTSWAASFAPE